MNKLHLFLVLSFLCNSELWAWTTIITFSSSSTSSSSYPQKLLGRWSHKNHGLKSRNIISWEGRSSSFTKGKRGNVMLVASVGDNEDPNEAISANAEGTSGGSSSSSSSSMDSSIGLNELQTLLREAVASENYKEAARLRDCIANTLSEGKLSNDPRKYQRLSWVGLGTAPWLVDRLEALNYILPTTIQIHAFESINEMLLKQMMRNQPASKPLQQQQQSQQQTLEELADAAAAAAASTSWNYNSDDDEKKGSSSRTNMAVIVSGSTGSGKTLAYLVPLLSTLSESLFERQRIRVKAESDVTDAADDLLSRVAIQTSPEVRGRSDRPRRPTTTTTMVNDRIPLSMGKSGRDVTSPLALIVVPSRELGIQTAMTLYELVGGSTKRTPTEFSGKRNMFKFKGPRGVKISCILDDLEAESGLTMQTDVAITTPRYLTNLLHDTQIKPDKLRVVVFDEADLALETTKEEDLKRLFQRTCTDEKKKKKKKDSSTSSDENDDDDDDEEEDDYLDHSRSYSRITYLVGASVTESLQQIPPVREHVLQKDFTYLATATSFAPLVLETSQSATVVSRSTYTSSTTTNNDAETTSLSQLKLHLDPGLIHERVIAPNNTRLLCLTRLLRKELQEYSQLLNTSATTTVEDAADHGIVLQRKKKISSPRVVIFFPDEEEAKACMPKLRDAMWGDYKLCVLLPNTGVSPLTVMEDFKLNKTSVMLATANSVRGLDFEG
jgi:superfamily II DNA/RNA helicase